ncbi:MAG TPA: alpha/beta hydrolase-fold protein [Pseudomonadales bacterium]|nr:alpha/beta hydrolase-fold protein [Pseudomonadales bacterium]
MPVHNFAQPAGRVEYLTIESKAIANNVLGDPATRTVAIYLPAGYDASKDEYPLFVDIVGFTGSGLSHIAWKAYGESVPQRIDRLIAEGKMGPVVVALPDCFTSLGGNQYVNSAAMGNWADFLTGEMIPAIEANYRVKKDNGSRAVFGKSSGGYGSIAHGMLHAEHWGAIACHSGDMAFEWCYLPDLPNTLMHLAKFNKDIKVFVESTQSALKINDVDFHHLMNLAMAASYDPAPQAPFGVQLPVDLETCELIPERWEKWLAWDPVQLVEQQAVQDNLRSLKGIYIDCGAKDQYNLIFGARKLTRRLAGLGIDHHYEEFDDNHSSVDYRMDISLPWLYHQLEG